MYENLTPEMLIEMAAEYERTNHLQEAEACYLEAAAKGYAQAQYRLAVKMDKLGNYDDAFGWAMKAAQQEHADACEMVSQYYKLGKLTLSDEEKANYWQERANSVRRKNRVVPVISEEELNKRKKRRYIRYALLALEVLFLRTIFTPILLCLDHLYFDNLFHISFGSESKYADDYIIKNFGCNWIFWVRIIVVAVAVASYPVLSILLLSIAWLLSRKRT